MTNRSDHISPTKHRRVDKRSAVHQRRRGLRPCRRKPTRRKPRPALRAKSEPDGRDCPVMSCSDAVEGACRRDGMRARNQASKSPRHRIASGRAIGAAKVGSMAAPATDSGCNPTITRAYNPPGVRVRTSGLAHGHGRRARHEILDPRSGPGLGGGPQGLAVRTDVRRVRNLDSRREQRMPPCPESSTTSTKRSCRPCKKP